MPVSGATWSGLAALAVLSVLLPHTLFMGGLKHVVPSRAIIISTLEPVVAIGSAALVLGEYLRGVQIGGALLVLAAVILLNVRPEHRVHHPPEG
jgi:drug/metabolite transporter (DMT)-like permease